MERRFLEDCLGRGMSLEAIGGRVGKHPSTVSYWLSKHGLRPGQTDRYAPKGGLTQEQLAPLVEAGHTLREIAERLDRSLSTVRYWLGQYGLRSANRCGPRRRHGGGAKTANFKCKRHGFTEFTLEGRDHYRCKRCRSAAVVQRRRVTKQRLVEEAGRRVRPLRISSLGWCPSISSPGSQSQEFPNKPSRALALVSPVSCGGQ
jgi:transposase